jgi:hypothetical protein
MIKKTPVEQQISLLESVDLESVQVLNDALDRQVLMFLLLNGYHVKSNFVTNGA